MDLVLNVLLIIFLVKEMMQNTMEKVVFGGIINHGITNVFHAQENI